MPDDRRTGERRDPGRQDFRTHPLLNRRNPSGFANIFGKQTGERRKSQTPEWIRRAQAGNLPTKEDQRGK